MKKFLLLTLAATLYALGCDAQLKTESVVVKTENIQKPQRLPLVKDAPIKNVIFIIGDGTGLAQLYNGQLALAGKDGLLHLQTMPVTGFSKTYSKDNLITDSAAGATAYSCGAKTDNGMIGYLPDGSSCKTILELAEEKGMSTGVVATSTVTHATPASYAAHVDSRKKEDEIAAQFLDSGMEIILGGGREFFAPQSEGISKRKDNRNLIAEFEGKGYDFVDNVNDLNTSEADQILGLFYKSGMDSEDRTPSLKEMTSKAIEVLSKNEDGFFLMVEGSQIDWAGHSNDINYQIREVADFDAAIKTILDFAVKDGETLVVLTADHETGGLTIQDTKDFSDISVAWTTGHHTGIPVPVMAYGPHAIEFTGWWENIEIGQKVAEISGIGTLPVIIK